MSRRDFLKASGLGLMATTSPTLLSDLSKIATGPSLLESRFGITRRQSERILEEALSHGGDFSELFFEYRIIHSIQMEEGIFKESSQDIRVGVGIRVVKGEKTGYAYTDEPQLEQIRLAARTAATIADAPSLIRGVDLRTRSSPLGLYDLEEPWHTVSLTEKAELIRRAYAAAEAYDPRIEKVQAWLVDEIQYVTIAHSEGIFVSDIRPQVRLQVRATAAEGNRRNTGFSSVGGRTGPRVFDGEWSPESVGRRAAEEAVILLSAIDPPAGEQPVVLGSDQSGVMIHEAVGHPLEADANRKQTSIMWNRLGQQVASPLVTIYDDPTIPRFRGSLAVDDEGTFPKKTLLIEKGRLVGFLQDRLSARIMGFEPTGHGRRESYRWIPIPRMCNTVLEKGEADPEAIIRSVKKGFYAKTFQGGQVQDSGKFTFSVNLGYLIEDGRLTRPIKNATLIGTNLDILHGVEMVGNDMGFFLGTCGKEGQSVPVTAGTPTLKLKSMTVGGRA